MNKQETEYERGFKEGLEARQALLEAIRKDLSNSANEDEGIFPRRGRGVPGVEFFGLEEELCYPESVKEEFEQADFGKMLSDYERGAIYNFFKEKFSPAKEATLEETVELLKEDPKTSIEFALQEIKQYELFIDMILKKTASKKPCDSHKLSLVTIP
jgi:hypothetical protein